MADLPSGTVTFLLTDIEGRTALWEREPEAMRRAIARHDTLLATIIERIAGHVIRSRGEGNSVFAVFARTSDAVAAACEVQRALVAEAWPTGTPLRVRMALHTGEADLREGDYFGAAVNRCARLRSLAYGGQVLLSQATHDLARPERVYQLHHPDLPSESPSLRSLDAHPNDLPTHPTALLGREREVAAIRDRLSRSGVHLMTLTGPGGTGKTRLALQVAADLLGQFPDGAYFVALAPITDPGLLPSTAARPPRPH